MEKLKNLLKGKSIKTMALSLCLMALSAPMAFAETSGASTAITTAMGGVKTEFDATVTGVAPIAIGIIAVFLVWKYGIGFFTSLTKKGTSGV